MKLFKQAKLQTNSMYSVLLCAAIASLAVPVAAYADSPISLKNLAELEVLQKNADGTVTKVRKPAVRAIPGDVVHYSNIMTNISTKKADNLVLDNPIPANTTLVSAWGDGAKIEYSIDGKKFDVADKLTVTENGKVRKAGLDDFAAVRWKFLRSLPPKDVFKVGFDVKVK